MQHKTKKMFGTDGIRGSLGSVYMHPEFILKLGWAFGKMLAAHDYQGPVLIGKDTRVSGYILESVLESGLAASGYDVLLVGPMPTPAIAYLTKTFRAAAGIVISASHNLYQDNGIKFFGSGGEKLLCSLEAEIAQWVDQPMILAEPQKLGKAERINDAAGRYVEFCKRALSFSMRFSGLKIVLDCAHGATYQVAPLVFRELGAHVVVLHNQPNGYNINEACGSTQPKALQQAVLAQGADCGLAFDGDGDRLLMVDAKGNILDGDALLYLLVAHRIKAGTFSGGVVGTIMSNQGLAAGFKALQVPFVRSEVGDKHVMQQLRQRGWLLGGESSGHLICCDTMVSGDAIVAGVMVLAAMHEQQCDLAKLLDGYQPWVQHQYAFSLLDDHIRSVLLDESFQDKLVAIQQKNKDQGRVLMRQSGTEPKMRLLCEAHSEAALEQMVGDFRALFTALKIEY
jgi:phosphoglucosamine mutase